MKLRIPSHTLMTGRSSALPALALFSLATMSAQGVSVLLDDNFTNAVRVGATNARTGVDRDGVATLTNDWVMALNTTTAATQTSDSNAPRVATGINGNSLAVTNTGLAYSLSTYFTPTTLAPGESISATFNVRTTGFTVLALDTAFRFGLFDSNSGQLAANSNFSGGAGSAIGTVFQDDRGYAAYYDTTTGISTGTHEFRERISAGAANNSNLFTPGQFSTLVGGVTAASVFAIDTTYPVTITIELASDGSAITTSSSFNGINLSLTDTPATTTQFDHLSIFFGSQFGSAATNGTQFIDDVNVTLVPEPGAALLGGLGLLALLRRRR